MISRVDAGEGPFQRTESPLELRLAWNNRRVRRDRFMGWFLVLFWIVWAPATVFATWMIFHSGSPIFFSIWCIFGWLGTLLIPYTFVQRTWTEWVSLSAERLELGAEGWLAGKPKEIPLDRITAITLGCKDDESVPTLNLICRGKRHFESRRMIGYWLHPELKEQLFVELRTFAARNRLNLAFRKP